MALNLSERKTFWADRRVLITGNSGFKGAWLQGMLAQLGANVVGLSLYDCPTFKLHKIISGNDNKKTYWGDIRHQEFVCKVMANVSPDVIFHLAAQPLVSEGLKDPIKTFETNILGTANVLNACRKSKNKVSFFNVTSDKCYVNNESGHFFREDAPLGGADPYSASKAAVEIIGNSLARILEEEGVIDLYISGRAGNVFGGGDFSQNRLIPDIIRSLESGVAMKVRSPNSIRPWQFVLCALDGYLKAVESHSGSRSLPRIDSYNFGPIDKERITVAQLIDLIPTFNKKKISYALNETVFKEANFLNLDTTKAQEVLRWSPSLGLLESLQWTFDWYSKWLNKEILDLRAKSISQITEYLER